MLLPQDHQRYAAALELFMHLRPIGQRLRASRGTRSSGSPIDRGQSFQSIADSIPMIADSSPIVARKAKLASFTATLAAKAQQSSGQSRATPPLLFQRPS